MIAIATIRDAWRGVALPSAKWARGRHAGVAPFWINPRSSIGTGERSPALLKLVESFTLKYCRNVLGDTSITAEILEEALERMERSQQRREIREPAAYVRRTIVRRVRQELAHGCRLQRLGSVAESIPAKPQIREDDRILAG